MSAGDANSRNTRTGNTGSGNVGVANDGSRNVGAGNAGSGATGLGATGSVGTGSGGMRTGERIAITALTSVAVGGAFYAMGVIIPRLLGSAAEGLPMDSPLLIAVAVGAGSLHFLSRIGTIADSADRADRPGRRPRIGQAPSRPREETVGVERDTVEG